jgi:hypothetical protein
MSRHNMQSNTLTRQEYEGKIYVKNIGKYPKQDTDTDPKPTEK